MSLLEFTQFWHDNYLFFTRQVDPLIVFIHWCMLEQNFKCDEKVIFDLFYFYFFYLNNKLNTLLYF